jgi:hypothetical protein
LAAVPICGSPLDGDVTRATPSINIDDRMGLGEYGVGQSVPREGIPVCCAAPALWMTADRHVALPTRARIRAIDVTAAKQIPGVNCWRPPATIRT